MIQRGPTRFWFRLAAFAAVAVLLALALLVYSPWHQDDRLSGKVCPFCHFQHLPALAEGGAVYLLPEVLAIWLALALISIRIASPVLPAATTRGPPVRSRTTRIA